MKHVNRRETLQKTSEIRSWSHWSQSTYVNTVSLVNHDASTSVKAGALLPFGLQRLNLNLQLRHSLSFSMHPESLKLRSCVAWICLRTGNRTCFLQLFELAHMFDATQHLGLGWGWGVITFLNLNTCRCYATSGLAHMFDATQHLMLRNIWACTHVRCYATSGLAHMFDATQHLGLHTCSMLRNIWAWGGGGV